MNIFQYYVDQEWDSTNEAKEITGLETGKTYTLRETVAPAGYAITTDTTFTIAEDGTVTASGQTTTDENGVGHAYGHAKRSVEIAEALFDRMHFDARTRERALTLIERHDMEMRPEPKLLKRQLNRFGEETVRQLIAVHCADSKAHGIEAFSDADERAAALTGALDTLLASNPCCTLASLAVNGGDLIRSGMKPGKQLGDTLKALLDAVMDERVPNEKEALLALAKAMRG